MAKNEPNTPDPTKDVAPPAPVVQLTVTYRCKTPFMAWGNVYNTGDTVNAADWIGEGKTTKDEAVASLRRRIANDYVEITEV